MKRIDPALDGDQLALASNVFAQEPSPLPVEAKPYGPLGLVLSTVAILVAMLALVIVVALAAFGIAVALYGMHTVLDLLTNRTKAFEEPFGLIASTVVYAALIASVLVAARVRGGARWRDIVGWHPWRPWKDSLFVWVLYGLAIAYNIAASAAITAYYPPAKDWITLPNGATQIAMFAVVAVIAAPIAEELLFRGWIYTSLRRFGGVPLGLIVSAALFALAHWEGTHLYALVVFPLGIVLGYVRQRTGSILASMTFHALYNGFAVVLLSAGF